MKSQEDRLNQQKNHYLINLYSKEIYLMKARLMQEQEKNRAKTAADQIASKDAEISSEVMPIK